MPAPVFIRARLPPSSLITPVTTDIPPEAALNAAFLFRTTAPENVDVFAVVPPMVAVPLLPA